MAKTKTKKSLSTLLVVVLLAAIAVGGMLAYLTDRDSEANVFTVGDVKIDLNEKFEQGAELMPGVKVEKEATITNTGKNDAYVWMTLAVPAALDNANAELGTENVLHWNMPGCFWNGYHNQEKYIQSGIANGYLPAGSTGVADEDSWINKNEVIGTENIDGVDYNLYAFLYKGAIKSGETTNIALSEVYVDAKVDIDTDGNWYIVENGETTAIDWNSNEDGAPIVYVSAYAIQAEGFDTVEKAYAAYQTQWGSNGTEYADPDATVAPEDNWIEEADTSWYDGVDTNYEISTAKELAGLAVLVSNSTEINPFANKTVTLTADIDLSGYAWTPIGVPGKAFGGTFDGNGHTISNLYVEGTEGVGLFGAIFNSQDWADNVATVENVTVENATVNAVENAAVIVGFSYGSIDNCTVIDSKVIVSDGKAGAIVGSTASDSAQISISGNKAENVTITGNRAVGAMVGRLYESLCTHTNNTWNNVTVNGTVSNIEVGEAK